MNSINISNNIFNKYKLKKNQFTANYIFKILIRISLKKLIHQRIPILLLKRTLLKKKCIDFLIR